MLNKKTALVCASSKGIGKSIALALSKAGADIIICSRNSDSLYAAKLEIEAETGNRVYSYQCDLSNPESILNMNDEITQEFDGVDILVNNQGGPLTGEILDLSEDDFDAAYTALLRSNFILSRKHLPKMVERKWGRIINVLSISAKQPLPNMLLSNTFRPAILGVSKSLSNQFAKDGVTVNSILPANVLTARTNALLRERAKESGETMDNIMNQVACGVPAKSMVEPGKIGEIAVFLASDAGSFITGTSIAVDGGMSSSLI
jgi:3-oxoacyl-[acyl-carrier protein] reductase